MFEQQNQWIDESKNVTKGAVANLECILQHTKKDKNQSNSSASCFQLIYFCKYAVK